MQAYDEDHEQIDDCIFTKEDFKNLAKFYLTLFFKNKVNDDGFAIESEDLLTNRNIFMVLNFDICGGMPLIYESLKNVYAKEIQKRKGKVAGDIQFVLNTLNECSKMSIPKSFASGLLAVYIEMCKGCKINVNI
jgi:hypothetical protein